MDLSASKKNSPSSHHNMLEHQEMMVSFYELASCPISDWQQYIHLSAKCKRQYQITRHYAIIEDKCKIKPRTKNFLLLCYPTFSPAATRRRSLPILGSRKEFLELIFTCTNEKLYQMESTLT